MWEFVPRLEIEIPELLNRVFQYKEKIEGITILGGEPLDQYEETFSLLTSCAKSGLSTMLFTGYDKYEIKEKGMIAITKNLDILITGRYEEQKRTLRHQWIGSTNQTIYFLTKRYDNYRIINSNYTELVIDEDGSLTILGFPDEKTKKLLNDDFANH
jgi:anaerobic ribonucleoside-triphosphate reductase activating protein